MLYNKNTDNNYLIFESIYIGIGSMQVTKVHRLNHSTTNNNNNTSLSNNNSNTGSSHKLDLLQSNINRVRNQHDALQALLSDHANLDKAYAMVQKAAHVTSKVQEIRDQYRNKSKDIINRTESNQQPESILQLQTRLSKLKQKLSNLHKKQASNTQSKSNLKSSKFKSKNSHQPNILDKIVEYSKNQLQQLKSNIDQYLHKIKQQTVEMHQHLVIEYVNNYLDQENIHNNQQWSDIQADIGLLICQLQYKQFINQKANIATQIKAINQTKHNKQKNQLQIQQANQKQVISIGQLQYNIACNRIQKFINGVTERLSCACKLLQQRICVASQCIKANAKHKHKNLTISTKYQTQLLQFIERSHKIYMEIQGAKIEVRQMTMKIRFIDQKIIALGGISQSEQILKGVFKQITQIQNKWKNCQTKLEQFKKLEISFKTNQSLILS